jgi:Thioesterase domain
MSASSKIDRLAIGRRARGRLAHGVQLQRTASKLRRLAAGAAVIAGLGIALPAIAQGAKIAPQDPSRPHVYLMRGLMNIFSLGMDQLATQVARNGIDATVYNHSVAETVVQTIAQKYRGGDHGPYILVGHSLGADAVMTMAAQLNLQGVPVALVVPFDGTGSYAAPGNVSCVLNLTQRRYAYVQAGAGFHGKLSNVDVSSDTSVDHFTIDKSPRLQGMALTAILQAAHGQPCRPVGGPPTVARAKEPQIAKEIAPKEIAPKEIAPKEIAPKEIAPKESASKEATPNKSASSNKSIAANKTTSPNKSAPPNNGAAPAKSAAPAKNGAPAKSASPIVSSGSQG